MKSKTIDLLNIHHASEREAATVPPKEDGFVALLLLSDCDLSPLLLAALACAWPTDHEALQNMHPRQSPKGKPR